MLEEIKTRVRHYYKLNKPEQALKFVDEGLSLRPMDGWLLYMRAACLVKKEMYKEAREYFREALQNGFDALACHFEIGRTYYRTGDYYEAEECFQNALSIKPDDAEVLAAYGFVCSLMLRRKKALELVERALSLAPDNPMVHHYGFLVYTNSDLRPQEKRMLEKYFQSGSDDMVKFFNAGLHEYRQGRFRAAYENFSQAFALDPSEEKAISYLIELEYLLKWYFFPARVLEMLGKKNGMLPIFMGGCYFGLTALTFRNSNVQLGTQLAFLREPVFPLWVFATVATFYAMGSRIVMKGLTRKRRLREGLKEE